MTSVKLLVSATVLAMFMQAPVHAVETSVDRNDVSIQEVLKQDLVGQVFQFNHQFTLSITSVAREQLDAGKLEFENAMLEELSHSDQVLAERNEKGDKPLAP